MPLSVNTYPYNLESIKSKLFESMTKNSFSIKYCKMTPKNYNSEKTSPRAPCITRSAFS